MESSAEVATGQTRPSSKPATNSSDPLKGGGFSVISQVSKPHAIPSQNANSYNSNLGAAGGI